MVGAWNFENPQQPADVDKELMKVLEETLTVDGAGYKPLLLCGSQASARNYLFICEQTLVVQHPEKHIVAVTFHLDGAGDKGTVSNIARI